MVSDSSDPNPSVASPEGRISNPTKAAPRSSKRVPAYNSFRVAMATFTLDCMGPEYPRLSCIRWSVRSPERSSVRVARSPAFTKEYHWAGREAHQVLWTRAWPFRVSTLGMKPASARKSASNRSTVAAANHSRLR